MNSGNSDSVSTSSTNSANTTTVPVSQSWCNTKSVSFKIEHKWTIEDFSFYSTTTKDTDYIHVTSSTFYSSSNDKIKFSIKLYPNGNDEANKDHLTIFLYTFFEDKCDQLCIEYKFTLIDKSGKMCHPMSCRYKPSNNSGRGSTQFLARSLLFGENSELLIDDKLTIHCEVRVSMDRYTISGNDPTPGISNTVHQNALSSDLKTLLDKGTHSDVLLVIGSTQYSAHKNILSARSPVLEAMFAHKETEENVQNRVDIIDIPEGTFQELLNYIYSGQVPENAKLTSELLSAADKYQIEPLKAACEEALSSGFDVDT